MDIDKLGIAGFKKIKVVNKPADIDLGLKGSASAPEVLIYFAATQEDLGSFVSLCWSLGLPEENRAIIVFKKGRKALSRNMVVGPFRDGTYRGFKLMASQPCSLSEEYSALVLKKI
jgi:hypothetical protein